MRLNLAQRILAVKMESSLISKQLRRAATAGAVWLSAVYRAIALDATISESFRMNLN